MHWTTCAPGYPSDLTRSLAGVGLQDGLRAAAGALTTLAASGWLRSSAFTTGRGPGRAGQAEPPSAAQRAGTFVCDAATSVTTDPRHQPRCPARADGVGDAGPTTTSHAFASLRHHPRPLMLLGVVQHCGQAPAVCGIPPLLPAHSLWPASGSAQ